MRSYWNIPSFFVVFIVSAILVYIAVNSTAALRGTPEEFIEAVCLDDHHTNTSAYPAVKGIGDFYYYRQHPHNRSIYVVRSDELHKYLETHFPGQIKLPKEYSVCGDILKKTQSASQFLEKLNSISAAKYLDENGKASLLRFEIRVAQQHRKWFTFLFEIIIICGSIVWVFCKKTPSGYVVSLRRYALFPLIFLTPYYLGYCMSIYSTLPPGGLLYPILAMLIGLPFLLMNLQFLASVNEIIMSAIPKPFYFIEIDRGEWGSASGLGAIPLVELLMVTAILILISGLRRRLKGRGSP